MLVVVWSADNALAESVTINNGPSHGWDAAWNIAAASALSSIQYVHMLLRRRWSKPKPTLLLLAPEVFDPSV